jgi:hypothetical protein
MDNKEHTMDELHDAACVYAMALVEYHQARNSDWCDKDRAVRVAYNALCDAQNTLNNMAEEMAK